MILPEEPEPPDDCYKVRKEWFSRKIKMYVVREKSTGEFVTAMASRNLAMDWIDRRNQRSGQKRRR